MDDYTAWVGRSETARDTLAAAPLAALAATLDHPPAGVAPGTPLAPLAHWLYFLPAHRQSELGPDGHARRGGFLPPVPLQRRMWAGGRFVFHAPLRVGDRVERRSTIEAVSAKQGRSGPLVFVRVRHELAREGAVPALVEWHDIVYRDAAAPGIGPADPAIDSGQAPATVRPAPEWHREIVADDVLLFRYSALTFNGHRIHYDRRYATAVEGYPGLVVHGPLIATLLVDLLLRHVPGADLATYSFRALRPVFDGAPFSVNGRRGACGEVALWAQDAVGRTAMEATAVLRG